eukprot:TRINITY_DN5957_c0_g1_i1.p1 TRINITY_DN5957_c0_g1~~TRINITY_DN5957_c0_g1_i1.p1  ORF type:complete len:514 (-),score=171.28 TRINITY_DN5957_c0_g1_i1:255-1712(-)
MQRVASQTPKISNARICGFVSRSFSNSRVLNVQVVNPATGQKGNFYPDDTKDSIQQKYSRARAAQSSWASTPVQERIKTIERFGRLLEERRESLARDLTGETGKPIGQANGEIKGLQARVKFFVDNVEKEVGESVRKQQGNVLEVVRHEPLGVIANISAWNYPYFVGGNVFLPALLTGNAVLYKPSEYCPQTGLNIAQLLHDAGVPKDVFATVIGAKEAGEALVDQPINGVFFTGSNATGAKIAKRVGDRMVRLQLELGGKDPTYVAADADPEGAARSLADGVCFNTGQGCCSVERIYVHEKVYDKFMETLVNEVKSFKPADPLDDKTYIGPLTLPNQVGFLEGQVKDAVAKGAKLLVGGHRVAGKPGNWFEPTVLAECDHNMDVMVEESFGPIVGVKKVASDDEAIKLMNDTKYGLTSGVYSKSRETAERVLSKVDSGTVYWNACDRVAPALPWSGRRGSGIGATLGVEGIQAFVQPKAWHLIG